MTTRLALNIVSPTATDYKQYSPRTHVYMKPDMYIGADGRVTRNEWVYNTEENKMMDIQLDFVPGAERLFLEILTNASDNVGRSRRAGVDPGKLEVLMNNSTVSITNYGLPMPIEIHPDHGIYVPELVLGSLLTSSNYDKERHEAGTNGIGAKATNIYSKQFMVVVYDAIRHIKYTQVWSNNMKNKSSPILESYDGKVSSVQVTYVMDFTRFGYPEPNGEEGGYPVEAFALFARHAIDISFTAKTTVSFNGKEFNMANIRDYARLYFGDAVNDALVHYQWPEGTEVVNKKKGYQIAKDSSIVPVVELIALDTPDEGNHVSFVNCMMTRDGGVHVGAAFKAIGDGIVHEINETILKTLTKQNKGKELTAKEKRANTITIAEVKPHISILLSVRVVNPKFTSQTKTCLSTPTPKIVVEDSTLQIISKWKLVDRLYAALEAKQFANDAKGNGRLRKHIRTEKGVDANNAGKANRANCMLYIAEGKSAISYCGKLIALIEGGRDNIGTLPMKGKSLNVMNANRFKLQKNKEINELKNMLGLVEFADYTNQENFNKLRYGGLMIMADSDDDGKHIVGLILNFFHCRCPSLLAMGYVMYYRTPILRVWKNKKNRTAFYTQQEYLTWKNSTKDAEKWDSKYYKGLASSEDNDVKEDFQTPRVVHCFYDIDAPAAIRLAFDKNLSDRRKEWIGKWKPVLGIEDIEPQPISLFINHEFIQFSISNIIRSIPKLTDGFKESHRKIIFGAYEHWKNIGKSKDYKEYKVGRFGNFVAEKTNYHHGETILSGVITGMAQDFVGANNLPWFNKNGQFGCLDPNTPVRTWKGEVVLASDITMEDILVGDDGKPRHISKIVSGYDDMYIVKRKGDMDYIVNSQHILTLYDSERKQPVDINIQEYLKSDRKEYLYNYTNPVSLGNEDTLTLLKEYVSKSQSKIVNNGVMIIDKGYYPNIVSLCRKLGFASFTDENGYLIITGELFEGFNFEPKYDRVKVEYYGKGPYVGWYIDGNERFLLGDYTVTHNTRYELGKDAGQVRYTGTTPAPLFHLILRNEDIPILKRVEDEGELIEPETYYPVIPMILANGAEGIATGYSTSIPCHNPLDLVEWCKLKLQGTEDKELPLVLPWYRGFEGTIKVFDRRKKKRGVDITIIVPGGKTQTKTDVEDDPITVEDILPAEKEDSDDENYTPKDDGIRPLLSMISIGKHHVDMNGVIYITELPIGRSPDKYKKWLDDLIEEKKIKTYRNNSIDNRVYFEIHGFTDTPTEKALKLRKTLGMSNMVLLDENNKPIRYDSSYEILEAFYYRRLPVYQQRKDYILGNLKKEVDKLNHKIKFINAILITKEIVVQNVTKQSVYESMDKLQIPHEIYDNSKIHNLSIDDIKKLEKKIKVMEEEYKTIEGTTIQQMWINDLNEFETGYRKHYGIEKKVKLMVNKA